MFLGIDLGTTNVKAAVLRDDGRGVSRGAAPVTAQHLSDGGIEQDLEAIWQATLAALREAAAGCDAGAVRAIGVSSQGGALQICDSAGAPAGPVISWMDPRGQPFDQQLTAERGADFFADRIGFRRSHLTIGQVLRLRQVSALPEGYRIHFVGDLIVGRLSGTAAHDATSLSLGMMYNPRLDRADPDVLALLGVTEDRLPALLSPRDAAGPLDDAAARATLLPAGIPVSPAVHDQYASALGAGVFSPGDAMLGTGTAWVVLSVADALAPADRDDAIVCRHVVAERFGLMQMMRVGGSTVEWAARLVGLAEARAAEIDRIAAEAPPGCEGVRFQPFLRGPGAGLPGDVDARLTGLKSSHGQAHVLRAALESVARPPSRPRNAGARAGQEDRDERRRGPQRDHAIDCRRRDRRGRGRTDRDGDQRARRGRGGQGARRKRGIPGGAGRTVRPAQPNRLPRREPGPLRRDAGRIRR